MPFFGYRPMARRRPSETMATEVRESPLSYAELVLRSARVFVLRTECLCTNFGFGLTSSSA